MWIIGNSLVDPCSHDYLVIIKGASKSEKSTMLKLVSHIFKNTMTVMRPDLIICTRVPSLSAEPQLMSSRIAVSSDLDFSS